MELQAYLKKSARHHSHLCPRQILGVRMGLAGLHVLGFSEAPPQKRLLVILETDGCFADGIIAATNCTVGHRSLRVEDYGKAAAVFVDTVTQKVVRLAPALDIRERAFSHAAGEPRPYFAQMQAYRVMPEEEMFTVTPVALNTPIETIISRPGLRVKCDHCGEEIMNEREVKQNGLTLCLACAGAGYYHYQPAGQNSDQSYATQQEKPAFFRPGCDI
jgi:formylmethanofuran dehydrogenase subunit E